MEALTISAANLDTIEKNLGSVAKELNGVVSNVSDVREHVNEMDNKVEDLHNEVKNLVKDIKETTIITNARQAIMYNNEQIEKKYGYYDNVRRNTLSLLDACLHSNIRISSLIKLRDNILLNNPNYWLANALCALTSWILDDKENAQKEMQNALNKDNSKTSLFFALMNLKLGRNQTAVNWLNRYLSTESPLELDKHFITVLDLVSLGYFGDTAKKVLLDKIDKWFLVLNNESSIKAKQVDTWYDFLESYKKKEVILPVYRNYGPEADLMEDNLTTGIVYDKFSLYLDEVMATDASNKSIDDVLYDLIFEYEGKEQEFQKDNLLNKLIIECNGDRDEANRLYKKQEGIYSDKTDLVSLFSSIVLYKDNFKVSSETRKIALTYVKNYIIEALNKLNSTIVDHDFKIQINDFTTTSKDGRNSEAIKNEIDSYLGNKFDVEDKDLLLTLIIMDILGIIGLFLTRNGGILNILLIVFLVIGNLVLFAKMGKRNNIRKYEKNKLGNNIYSSIDAILAEFVDYRRIMDANLETYNAIITDLNNMQTVNYINSNGERNIDVGE